MRPNQAGLVYAQNFSFLACLEVAEKFVVGWWSRPSLRFSFSQAEQLLTRTALVNDKEARPRQNRKLQQSHYNMQSAYVTMCI